MALTYQHQIVLSNQTRRFTSYSRDSSTCVNTKSFEVYWIIGMAHCEVLRSHLNRTDTVFPTTQSAVFDCRWDGGDVAVPLLFKGSVVAQQINLIREYTRWLCTTDDEIEFTQTWIHSDGSPSLLGWSNRSCCRFRPLSENMNKLP